MKNAGEDFKNLLEKIEMDDLSKLDFRVQAKDLVMKENGLIVRKGKETREGLLLSEHAATQFLNRYDIPVKEGKMIARKDPEMFRQIFNDVVNEDDRGILIRARKTDKGYGIVRAVLSEDYSILNNKRIIETLERHVHENSFSGVESFYIDDRRFHARFTFDVSTTAFGRDVYGDDDLIKCGLDIINSETGNSSLRIEPMIFRLVCSNGLKAWRTDGDIIQQRHIFIDNDELDKLVVNGINTSLEKSNNIINTFEDAKKIQIEDPVADIIRLSEYANFSKKLTDSVIKNYFIEPMKNRYGVVNAFTRGARDLNNHQRLQVEEFAGRLLVDEEIYEVA